MSRFTSLLLPLDGSPAAAKGAGCALWLAEALGATLHVLHAAAHSLPETETLERLHVNTAQRAPCVLHQVAETAEAAVLDAITNYGVDLVIMSARGESAWAGHKPAQSLGAVAQAVIEQCPIPVLLLPVHYREVLPWTSILAAASGGIAADEALEVAVQLASVLQLKVRVVHVENGPCAPDSMPLGAYADSVHHEYPHRMNDMVERGLAGCTSEECGYVDQILLRRGDPATELLDQISRDATSMLALGWHGAFGPGHALVFQRLLEQAECALLLVRRPEGSTARLKIGNEVDG